MAKVYYREHNYKRETREFLVAPYLGHTYTLRSSRESMFASLLEVLVVSKSVLRWWYEPYTFKCGTKYRKERVYTPDFLIQLGDDDIFDTGTKCVWLEVKQDLDQKAVTRQRYFRQSHPNLPIILMVDRDYHDQHNSVVRSSSRKLSKKGRAKNIRQRELQDKAAKWVDRIIFAKDWYAAWGIKL